MVEPNFEIAPTSELASAANAETQIRDSTIFPEQKSYLVPGETEVESVKHKVKDAFDHTYTHSGINNTQDSLTGGDDDITEAGQLTALAGEHVLEKRSRSEKAKKRQKVEDDDSFRKTSGKYKLKRKKVCDSNSHKFPLNFIILRNSHNIITKIRKKTILARFVRKKEKERSLARPKQQWKK